MSTTIKPSFLKLWSIRKDLLETVNLHGTLTSVNCLKTLNSFLGSPSAGIDKVIKELLVQAIHLGSYDVGEGSNPEEHHTTAFSLCCDVEFEKSNMNDSATILLLAESYRRACESFKEIRSKTNNTSFLLCVLYAADEDYVPWTCNDFYVRFIEKYWLPALKSLVDKEE